MLETNIKELGYIINIRYFRIFWRYLSVHSNIDILDKLPEANLKGFHPALRPNKKSHRAPALLYHKVELSDEIAGAWYM